MTTLPSNSVTVSEYYKQDVYDAHDNKIGDVSDVLLDKNRQVTAVILGRPYEEKVRVSEEDLRALYARPTATGREHVRPEGP